MTEYQRLERPKSDAFVPQDSPAYGDVDVRDVVGQLGRRFLEDLNIGELSAVIEAKAKVYGLSIEEMNAVMDALSTTPPQSSEV